jgi:hypothetical protein
MTDLEKAAQAVLVRWDSPSWDWARQGPTSALMADLRRALAAHREQAEPVSLDAKIVHFAKTALHEMPRPATDWHHCAKRVCEAVVATNAQQAEPVAWMHKETGLLRRETNSPKGSDWDANYWLPLYSTTAPQQAEPAAMDKLIQIAWKMGFDAGKAEQVEQAEPVVVPGMDADAWLRQLYFGYKAHPDWRALAEAFNAGMSCRQQAEPEIERKS